MFDHLLESSRRDDSNKWSNIGFGEEIKQLESIEVNFTHLIWSSVYVSYNHQSDQTFWLLYPLQSSLAVIDSRKQL